MDLFVPGRICLLGEHSDWAGGYRRVNPLLEPGYAIICGTNQGIYARVDTHPTRLVMTATSPTGDIQRSELSLESEALLREAQVGGFWSYVAGTAYQIVSRYPVQGLVLENYRTDLPIRKGLSSSAAICVLTARAFNRLYHLGLDVREEMELAYQGELTTPSRCGRMDQGCAFGSQPVLMTFDGDQLDVRPLNLGGEFHFVIVDLRAGKDTRKILTCLNACFPTAQSEEARALQRLLGPNNKQLVHRAVSALKDGNAPCLGDLMHQAQHDFDLAAAPICPEELTAPALHRVLEYPPIQPLTWGGKGVGSQGDGAAQLLARSAADQAQVMRILENELGVACIPLTLKAS